jgi:hypothetical protein
VPHFLGYNAYISLGHEGSISTTKLSVITIEIGKRNSLLLYPMFNFSYVYFKHCIPVLYIPQNVEIVPIRTKIT